MEQFPSNSKRPARGRDEPKQVERVITGDVKRRKTPIGRRMSQHLIGGDVQSVSGYVMGDVLIPAFRDMIADAATGFVERMLFGDSSPGRARRSRGSSGGHIPYNRYSGSSIGRTSRDEPRHDISRRARANHSFDEIILPNRVDAEEVIDRLYEMVEKYEVATVMDLYGLVGVPSNYTDDKWGWTDLRNASVSRVKGGYLLNLPKPEPTD